MSLRDHYERLSPREQRMLGALGALMGAFVFLGAPVYTYLQLSSSREQNEAMKAVLTEIDMSQEVLAKRQAERVALEQRFDKPAPALASFIEKAASENGLEVPESKDRPPIDGKQYVERVNAVKMRKIGLKPLVLMLEKIKRSGYPVSVSNLTIRTRAGGPNEYDVELAVSAFERKAPGAAAASTTKKATTTKGREP